MIQAHKSFLQIYGVVYLEVEDAESGERIRRVKRQNLITTSGRNVIRDLILGNGRIPAAIAVGTTSTTPALADTALGAEVWRNEINRRTSSAGIATVQALFDTTDANGNSLVEAGLFDTSIDDQPTLVARVTYPAISKTSSIRVTVTWDINVS